VPRSPSRTPRTSACGGPRRVSRRPRGSAPWQRGSGAGRQAAGGAQHKHSTEHSTDNPGIREAAEGRHRRGDTE
jgi:hypothetical protein